MLTQKQREERTRELANIIDRAKQAYMSRHYDAGSFLAITSDQIRAFYPIDFREPLRQRINPGVVKNGLNLILSDLAMGALIQMSLGESYLGLNQPYSIHRISDSLSLHLRMRYFKELVVVSFNHENALYREHSLCFMGKPFMPGGYSPSVETQWNYLKNAMQSIGIVLFDLDS